MVLDDKSVLSVVENVYSFLDGKALILCTLTKRLVLKPFSLKLYQNQKQSTWHATDCRIRPFAFALHSLSKTVIAVCVCLN